jgi:hypothetical protein
MRRVEKATDARRRPVATDALVVLGTARGCRKELPQRPPWPLPDPDVRCREILKRISQGALVRLEKVLAPMNADEPFEEEVRRLAEAERRRLEAERRQRREGWERLLDSLRGSVTSAER